MRGRVPGERDAWAVLAVATAVFTVAAAVAQFMTVRLTRNEVAQAGSVLDLLTAMGHFRSARVSLVVVAGFLAVAAYVAFACWLHKARRLVGGADAPWGGRWYEWLVPGVNLVVPPLVMADLLAHIPGRDVAWRSRALLVVRLWWFAGLAFAGYTAYRWLSLPAGASTGTRALMDGARQPGPELVASSVDIVDRSPLAVIDGTALTVLAVATGLHVVLVVATSRALRGIAR